MKRESNPNIQISVYVSFIQIYNEKIFDLLQVILVDFFFPEKQATYASSKTLLDKPT